MENLKQRYLTLDFGGEKIETAFMDWGDPDNERILVCVHGLTRNSRDFDVLAEALAPEYRLICPDIVGRGKSGWLTHKEAYGLPAYILQIQALLASLGIHQTDWLGTSLGGLIGMTLSAREGSLIRKMVLNDVGPFLPKTALSRISESLSSGNRIFKDYETVKQYCKTVYAGFGALTEEQWEHLTNTSICRKSDGTYSLMYDPAIAGVFGQQAQQDISFWPQWAQIQCPTLVIHGENSDLLFPETVLKMQASKPDITVFEVPNTGHAPALMDHDQIDTVKHWLLF